MTVRTPSFIQDLCYTANDDRLTIGGLLCEEGVASFDGLRVTQTLPTADTNVVVSPGHLYIRADNGSSAEEAGYYHFYNDADFSIPIPANGTPSPITYVVWARVCDNQYTSGTSGGALLLGNANVTTEPSDDCTYYKLATVIAGASFVSIEGDPTSFGDTDLSITDERSLYTLCGTGGSLRDIITITTTDTFEKTDFPWLKSVRVKLVGGGGAGGGTQASAAGEAAAGSGGGGGGYSEKAIPVDVLGDSETVTIGVGGVGVSAGTGGTGGTTSFGSHLSATGGTGGTVGGDTVLLSGSPMVPSATTAGTGGVGTGGDVNIDGGIGHPGLVSFSDGIFVGSGGGTPLAPSGTGMFRRSTSAAGVAGALYGKGGFGASTISGGGNQVGGAGGAGVVIIELYG
jgi:hypothetical protein